ncbi:unnamed protein product [Thlaspi arvense]|uniref:AT-hook motif nuclear-localized protein n=1 Tax=Thlaspi arvense TaxID=13288 RepID=A0AAU9T8C7_THLAR|nr:unnamed protein product [Thlaspi arvense]
MDSREIHQQQQQQQQQQHHHQQQQLQPPPGMLMGSYNRNPNAAALMGPTSTSQAMHHLLPFSSLSPHQPQHHQQHPHHHQPHHHHHHPQPQQQMDQKTLESLGFEGSPSSAATQQQSMRFGIEQQQQQAKKKRGRPRKYAPDGNIGLALAPTSPLPSASNSYGGGTDGGGGGDSGGGANANSSDPPAKRNRGRPPGSGKKQLDALGGTGGVGFTPHVIEVKTGEDIAMKVMAFTNQGPRAICILSATGAVSSVMLRQANNPINPTGVVKYEVVVGSFVPDCKKQKQSVVRAQNNNPEPASAPANMLSFGGGGGGTGSPRSQGQQHSSESSEENESNSPLHRGSNSNNNNNHNSHGLFGNSTPQPLHQMPMPMYHHHLWPTSHNTQ